MVALRAIVAIWARMLFLRVVIGALAFALVLFGLVAMAAPTPLGFLVVGLGLALLTWSFPRGVRRVRKRWRRLDEGLLLLEARGPSWLSRWLAPSDPP
mgnify:FL=1